MLSKSRASLNIRHLVGSTGDEEPLVDAWVDWCRGEVLIEWNGRKLVRVDTAWGMLDGKVSPVEESELLELVNGVVELT